MKMQKYYFICYSVSKNIGEANSAMYNEVIDSNPIKWIIGKNNSSLYNRCVLVSYTEINKEEYEETKGKLV